MRDDRPSNPKSKESGLLPLSNHQSTLAMVRRRTVPTGRGPMAPLSTNSPLIWLSIKTLPVEYHRELTQERQKLSLRIDPCLARPRRHSGGIGVIDMELLSVIRRWHFRQGIAIREIKRRTGLSRNTIRKYLRAGTVEPVFKVPERPSKLDPFAEKLSGWLRAEAGKSRKQKRTAKQLYADLVVLGYEGSYSRVAAFARDWKCKRQYEQQTSGRGTFVPLVFQPGEAFQFDWSEDYADLGGKQVKLQVAHTKLSHSRAYIVRAYLLQTHEMLFDALTNAFRVFGWRSPAWGL
jgi:hypothetical protein